MAISCITAQTTEEVCADTAYTPKRVAGDAQINYDLEVAFTMPKRYNKDKRIETVGSPDALLKAEFLAIKKAAKTPENLARTIKKLQKKHSKIVFIEIPEDPISLKAKFIFGKYNRKSLPSYIGDTSIKYSDYWRLDSMALTTTENKNFKFTMDSIAILNCPFFPQSGSFSSAYSCKLNYSVLDLSAFSLFLANNPDFAKTFMESDIEPSITKYPFVRNYNDEKPIASASSRSVFSTCTNFNKNGVLKINSVLISSILTYAVRDIPLDYNNGLIKVKNNEKKAIKKLKKQVFKLNKR